MGGKESKQFPITFDEACKRVTDAEKRRLHDAFRRSSASNSSISKQVFVHDVIGESVPTSLAEQIFSLAGGGRGVSFRELLTVLVLLTRGTREEKIKFIYGLLAGESGAYIDRAEMVRHILDWEKGFLPNSLAELFVNGEKATFEQFSAWIDQYSEDLGVARWILSPNNAMSLISHLDTPTFYQTLAGVTHLSEQEIMELEKKFWTLVSTSGRIDVGIISTSVSPPLPSRLVNGLFNAFDENQDGHVDFKELACGVSAACRGPDLERQKFCFKIFDQDSDGVLNKDELKLMFESMLQISQQSSGTTTNDSTRESTADSLVKELLCNQDAKESQESSDKQEKQSLTLEEFLVWTVGNSLPQEFSNLIFQICHVVLGLRPSSRWEEGSIVRGWLAREERAGLIPGHCWYLVPMAWWTSWHRYVNWSEARSDSSASGRGDLGNLGTLGRKKNNALVSTLASDSSAKVVATGYTQLLDSDSRPGTPVHAPGVGDVCRQTPTPTGSPHSVKKYSSVSSNSSTPGSPARSASAPSRPGPIDNTGLIQPSPYRTVSVLTGEGGKLKNGGKLVRGKDYELVPGRLWNFLLQMYGGSPPLPRQVIRNAKSEGELELNPLSCKILKHQTIQRQPNVPTMVGGYSAAAMQAGGGSNNYMGAGLVGGAGPPSVTRRIHAYQAAFSRRTAISQIDDFLCGRLHVKAEDLRLWLFRGDEYNMKLLENESTTLEDAGFHDGDSLLAEIRSRDGTWPEEISSLCSDGRRPSGVQNALVPGVAGLNNLGNTCYMNAALQVVSSTKILAQYFKLNCHLYELNRTNPLGMKGHIAKRYGDLVREMWDAESKTIAPIKLRWTIGKYQPAFSSFQQQDSQELLAFLLDGLHEDLNRVTDKPYVELKDSDGRADLQVAAEAWENHILRNKSIIVDLFHGQLKSKVTCKVCGHESVRFDPFFNLSLPLPMERCVSIEVVVILQDGSTPVKYGLTMDMEDKLTAIPPRLARVCGVPPPHLVLVDIVQAQIRVITTNDQKLRSLNGSCIYAYELQRFGEVGVSQAVSSSESNVPQTFTDIQRTIHSKAKSKNGHIANIPPSEKVSGDEGEVPEEVRAGGGEVSWSRHICMPGLTFCFKSQGAVGLPDSPVECESPPLNNTPPQDQSSNHPTEALLPGGARHSRASSASSTLTAGTLDSDRGLASNLPQDLADASQGILVCLHRKMLSQEFYYLSSDKYRPSLFGIPLVVSANSSTTYQELYSRVWEQVGRLVSPLPPQDNPQQNHATDCDDSMGYEYPFVLKAVGSGGHWCTWCPWHRLCRGCPLPCDSTLLAGSASFLAIDWDPTALHLRYLAAAEKSWTEHPSVAESTKAATEPITLGKCLEAFTQEEELGENEKYYCSACKTHQPAIKKLQIWRLPPVLIIHLKRFHCVNGRWIKSHKIVDFPLSGLDPTNYLAAVPAATLKRYKELVSQGKWSSQVNRSSLLAGYCSTTQPIAESSEPSSLVNEADFAEDASEHFDTIGNSVTPPSKNAPPSYQNMSERQKDLNSVSAKIRQTSIGSGIDVNDVEVEVDDDDPNDSGIESSGGNGGHPTLERGASTGSEVFDMDLVDSKVSRSLGRTRQISTSLVRDPVSDDNLQDFHGHLLEEGKAALDVQYNMYAMVCHSGVLGGGHYVSYSTTDKSQWFCHNDSSCKEVKGENIDKSTAYILLYEREGLSLSDYLPDTSGLRPDSGDMDEEFDLDFKKQCSVM